MITEALLVHEAGAPFSYQEVTVNENLRDDEVLVEMKATGVCHTDLNFSKEKTIPGLFPAVFGHEGNEAAFLITQQSRLTFQRCRYHRQNGPKS
jgi:Zn-dependent alcohol dehydrogenase